jgi:hypothetical protein
VVRRRAGRPGLLGGADPLTGPAGARPVSCRRTTGPPCSAAPPGPGSPGQAAPPGTPRGVVSAPVQSRPADFNWAHPDVRDEFASVLRFWFDRGVDGFRIDSAGLLAKDPPWRNSARRDGLDPGQSAPGRARDRAARRWTARLPIRSSTGTRCTGSTATGGGSPRPTPDRVLIGESGCS